MKLDYDRSLELSQFRTKNQYKMNIIKSGLYTPTPCLANTRLGELQLGFQTF